MKCFLASICLVAACWPALRARTSEGAQSFNGTYINKEYGINLVINLDSACIEIPGLTFLGKTNGYMNGNIYGIWMVTSYKVKGHVAILRLSNDQGADSQTIKLTFDKNGFLCYEATDGNVIKRVSGRKLVKIPASLLFRKR